MSLRPYPDAAYAAWAAFHQAAQEVGSFALVAKQPAVMTDGGMIALNLGRVVVVMVAEEDAP